MEPRATLRSTRASALIVAAQPRSSGSANEALFEDRSQLQLGDAGGPPSHQCAGHPVGVPISGATPSICMRDWAMPDAFPGVIRWHARNGAREWV